MFKQSGTTMATKPTGASAFNKTPMSSASSSAFLNTGQHGLNSGQSLNSIPQGVARQLDPAGAIAGIGEATGQAGQNPAMENPYLGVFDENTANALQAGIMLPGMNNEARMLYELQGMVGQPGVQSMANQVGGMDKLYEMLLKKMV